ncbi:MAG: hypothetical protein IKV13_07685 [Akkermansia sp.]|nr:hypothetical protein [Akkermansia sp.]
MKFAPALLVCLLALQSCSLQEHLDKTTSRLEAQFSEIKNWEQLPLRTISWSQAVAMMKRNNIEYIRTQKAIDKAERSEMSVYTDLIPGVTYYGYFNSALSELTQSINNNEISHQINVNFYLPSLTQVPYRVYSSKAQTFAAIKALEGKERELIAKLYTFQRKHDLDARQKELESRTPEEKPDYLRKTINPDAARWQEIASLLGDYSARWQILPTSVPRLRWSEYRDLTDRMDALIVCQYALQLEQARMRQYSIALNFLPTVNTSLYSPQLFSSTGGTYSGTFLDMDDTKLNMSISYSLDTKLNNWNNYCDSKEAYELQQRETYARMVEHKQKLRMLKASMDEYVTWRDFMHKRIEHLRTAPAANAAEFLENETTLQSMQKELLSQEASAIESESALILQYGLR